MSPLPVSTRLVALCGALCLVTACSPTAASSGTTHGTLRAGATAVHVGIKANNPDCNHESAGFCPTYEMISVYDVAVDGPHMAVLHVHKDVTAMLALSDDGGATWRDLFIKPELGIDVIWNEQDVGVHLQDGKTYLVLSRNIDAHQAEWAFHEVNLSDGTLTERTPAVGSWPLRPLPWSVTAKNLHWRAMYSIAGTLPSFEDYDPATATVTHKEFQCNGAGCHGDIYVTPDGGHSFDSYSRPEADMICRFHWEEGVGPSDYCVPRAQWPGPSDNERGVPIHPQNVTGAQPYDLWAGDGKTWATAILPGPVPTVSKSLYFGPYRHVEMHYGGTNRPRFADNIQLLDSIGEVGEGIFVRLGPNGPEEARFPRTPCVDDAVCGYGGFPGFHYGNLQWLQPTGEGDYWAFYVVQWEAADNQQTLYVTRETPVWVPIAQDQPQPPVADPAGTSVLPLPTGSVPMPALARACAAYAGCIGGSAGNTTFNDCVNHFAVSTSAATGMASARARFLAAGTSCAAQQAAWPEGFGVTTGCPSLCLESGGTCTGDVCDVEVANPDLALCNSCDPDGSTRVCAGGRMFRATCTYGNACIEGKGCAGCAQTAYGCVSATVAGTCDAKTQTFIAVDCAPLGSGCAPQEGCVASHACWYADFGTWCDGANLLGCVARNVTFVDCRTLGFAGCGYGPDGARCE